MTVGTRKHAKAIFIYCKLITLHIDFFLVQLRFFSFFDCHVMNEARDALIILEVQRGILVSLKVIEIFPSFLRFWGIFYSFYRFEGISIILELQPFTSLAKHKIKNLGEGMMVNTVEVQAHLNYFGGFKGYFGYLQFWKIFSAVQSFKEFIKRAQNSKRPKVPPKSSKSHLGCLEI